MTWHAELADEVIGRYGERLADLPAVTHDAVTLRFDNGVTLAFRFATREEYSIRWRWGEAELGIDTAPVHAGLATFPHHRHDVHGQARPDRLTVPGDPPWDNLRRVLDAVLVDPLLETAPG